MITDRAGLDDRAAGCWRTDGGPWQMTPLAHRRRSDELRRAIPGQPAGTTVDYYLTGTDLAGVTVTDPVRAPQRLHTFKVGPDTTPPVLAHVPVTDQSLYAWPPTARCTATDNLGLDAVELTYRLNGGAAVGPLPLVGGADDTWSLVWPPDGRPGGRRRRHRLQPDRARRWRPRPTPPSTGDRTFAVRRAWPTPTRC